jgi:hypothetical protein
MLKKSHVVRSRLYIFSVISTRWFKYDRDDLCVNKSQFVPVIFEPPCILTFYPILSLVSNSLVTGYNKSSAGTVGQVQPLIIMAVFTKI